MVVAGIGIIEGTQSTLLTIEQTYSPQHSVQTEGVWIPREELIDGVFGANGFH